MFAIYLHVYVLLAFYLFDEDVNSLKPQLSLAYRPFACDGEGIVRNSDSTHR
ncbi:hypothetical protein M758_7G106900 [Ceratodon purpureus]|uniref:Uncharacterized protein n=1 Tax=Ceratodon purpureus TaxID=3225 RepID=A0A8T0HCL4_CERPU|nr:hypothetical protein KC19_7G169500 [Ceratodon purpureus]KAG0610996.1 hypothetical protein M758_7G106900 [Ceratodon purpureus]